MKRQILCLLLALALPFTLCACGSTRAVRTDDMPDPEDGYIENGRADDGVVDDGTENKRLPGSYTGDRTGTATGNGTTNGTGTMTGNGMTNGTGVTGRTGDR